MFRIGLVSATFRHLAPEEIIAVAQAAGIEGLTWSGDVHVPLGQPDRACEVARRTKDAGLEIEGYGSYYRAGCVDGVQLFERELEAVLALGAPRIRVWAGMKESAVVTDRERETIIEDLRRCGQTARQAGVTLAIEFHSHSLTDTAESTAALMMALEGSGARLYWQPPNGMPSGDAVAGLRKILPWVDHVHVFHWIVREGELIRLPLSKGGEVWPGYLGVFAERPMPRWALLEFVAGDDPKQFAADAQQLRDWLQSPGKC